MPGLRWRLFWPVILVALCLATLCVFTAMSLFHQQATLAQVFRENVASRRAAVELEECLTDLIALENAHVEAVTPLHDRAAKHIKAVREVSDEPEEERLATRIEITFADYLQQWRTLPPRATDKTARDEGMKNVVKYLESEVLHPCTEFRLYEGRRLEETTADHERVLNQLAWGMAGVGGLGAVAGIVFGFGLARVLSRSIRRLQVQLRSAAGIIDPNLPEIVLTGEGGFGGLHDEIDRLSTRIERVVQDLQDREREIVRAEQLAAVGQLAAGVGHEIRNPLTSIKMLIQAGLEVENQPGITPQDLRVIENEIRRMERSLQTFLEFARPPKPEHRAVDLLTIVNTVLGLVRGRVEKQNIQARLDAPAGPVVLTADPGLIQQVLVNLVLNALDAMPIGGALLIKVRQREESVVIEVSDTGRGLPTDILPRLFQPFVSSKETGLGLGLVISRRIVEDHGGTVDAGNRVGGGASFFVTLPTRDSRIGR